MTKHPTASLLLADPLALVREGLASLCTGDQRLRIVAQCGDGSKALPLIESFQPDLAIFDLNLPGMFALELVSKLRDQKSPTRTIILSSRCDRKTLIDSMRAGASGFVLKSGTGGEFLEAIHHVLSGSIYVSADAQLERAILPGPDDPLNPHESLSIREHQVFCLLVDGIRPKEIAARLQLSPKTVDTYRANLMRKLKIHDVAGLVKYAIQRDLIA